MIVHNVKTWSRSSTLSVPVDMEERKPHERLGYKLIADWPAFIWLKYISLKYLELLSRNENPSLGVLARNFIFLVRTLPFAAQMAFDHLSQAWANEQIEKSTGTAPRISFGMGLACKLRKRTAEARMHLEHRRLLFH
jgi:hypothetical protein